MCECADMQMCGYKNVQIIPFTVGWGAPPLQPLQLVTTLTTHYNFYNITNTFSTFVSKFNQNQQLCAIYILPEVWKLIYTTRYLFYSSFVLLCSCTFC